MKNVCVYKLMCLKSPLMLAGCLSFTFCFLTFQQISLCSLSISLCPAPIL